MLLTVDPGKAHAGVALFDGDGYLVRATTVKVKKTKTALDCSLLANAIKQWLDADWTCVDKVRCEKPSIWTQGGFRGNPNDILDLMATNGAIINMIGCGDARYVTTEWKGQVPKPARKKDPYIVERRVRKRLNHIEQTVFGDNPSWDTTDAVGVGLWVLKRF